MFTWRVKSTHDEWSKWYTEDLTVHSPAIDISSRRGKESSFKSQRVEKVNIVESFRINGVKLNICTSNVKRWNSSNANVCLVSGVYHKQTSFFLFNHIQYRAIPEAGYITLGTIRYGVKLSQGCLPSKCTHFRSASLGTVEYSETYPSSENSMSNRIHSRSVEYDTESQHVDDENRKNADNLRVPVNATSMPNVCDSDTSLSDVTSVNGSCCLNTTKCALPWSNKTDQSRSNDSCKWTYIQLLPKISSDRMLVSGCVCV